MRMYAITIRLRKPAEGSNYWVIKNYYEAPCESPEEALKKAARYATHNLAEEGAGAELIDYRVMELKEYTYE